jgi:signal transduction histidine kinase
VKAPLKKRTISTAIITPSAIVVVALALLQYRWSTRVSEATAVRLADSLQMSMMNLQKDLFRYLSEISVALRIDPVEESSADVGRYVRRLAEWKAVTKYPSLVSRVSILKLGAAAPVSERLDPSLGRFEPRDWPESLESVRGDLERAWKDLRLKRGTPGADIEDPSVGWLFDPGIPALFHPLNPVSAPPDWLAVELNRKEIQTHIFSNLARTYFQGTDGLDYLVAFVSGSAPGVMYSSDAGFGYPAPPDADGIIDLFGRVPNGSGTSPVHVFHAPSSDKGPDPSVKIAWFPLLRNTATDLDWRLVVRHRRGGPLGAFVSEMRRRDLAIGFGVLLVLIVNMAMLIITSHRAQQLAQLQIDFVTTVSHELRTPLSVIISGADNICKGVVETRQQLAQYGQVIGNQAKQLLGLVERILLFAAARQGPLRYNLRRLDVQEIIDAALTDTAGLLEANHFTVECSIEDGLPQILGDAPALSQCLQNLITNAVKYGLQERWIGIRAHMDNRGSHGNEVEISVTDRGIGISAVDMPHIFEPFYRSPSAKTAQIHGTGLGLSLSQSIAEAMNARISITSAPGHGSTFTLHLRCAERSNHSAERQVQGTAQI